MRARSETAAADVMYRLLILVLFITAVAVGAPQEQNKSGETYVKIQPINETAFQNLSPDLPSPVIPIESDNFDGIVQNNDITTEDLLEPTTEVSEVATETNERVDETLKSAEIKTLTKTPTPRFYSKLSYFQKPSYVSGPPLSNFLERNSKRKFKSRCRCEKIWNCPKLQITVPRCPDEYFMCCF